ncbi:hypothetical protein HZB89_01650, partial [archaeon]|nr:hypothetical protein [archaeon]
LLGLSLGIFLLLISVRFGFKNVKEHLTEHERKLDFHRRENILDASKHENKMKELEDKVLFLHEELQKAKEKNEKKKLRKKIEATV